MDFDPSHSTQFHKIKLTPKFDAFSPSRAINTERWFIATARAQRRRRAKYNYLKSQLNLMAQRLAHQDLAEIAQNTSLRGEGEAIGFASFETKGLIQFTEHNLEVRKFLELFNTSYERDRDLYS